MRGWMVNNQVKNKYNSFFYVNVWGSSIQVKKRDYLRESTLESLAEKA